jgi:hypothetical protein
MRVGPNSDLIPDGKCKKGATTFDTQVAPLARARQGTQRHAAANAQPTLRIPTAFSPIDTAASAAQSPRSSPEIQNNRHAHGEHLVYRILLYSADPRYRYVTWSETNVSQSQRRTPTKGRWDHVGAVDERRVRPHLGCLDFPITPPRRPVIRPSKALSAFHCRPAR